MQEPRASTINYETGFFPVSAIGANRSLLSMLMESLNHCLRKNCPLCYLKLMIISPQKQANRHLPKLKIGLRPLIQKQEKTHSVRLTPCPNGRDHAGTICDTSARNLMADPWTKTKNTTGCL